MNTTTQAWSSARKEAWSFEDLEMIDEICRYCKLKVIIVPSSVLLSLCSFQQEYIYSYIILKRYIIIVIIVVYEKISFEEISRKGNERIIWKHYHYYFTYITMIENEIGLYIPGTGYFIMAKIFRTIIGAQQVASVKTIKKNLKANSISPTDNGVAWRVFQMLANMPA